MEFAMTFQVLEDRFIAAAVGRRWETTANPNAPNEINRFDEQINVAKQHRQCDNCKQQQQRQQEEGKTKLKKKSPNTNE